MEVVLLYARGFDLRCLFVYLLRSGLTRRSRSKCPNRGQKSFCTTGECPPISSWPECRTALFLDAHIHTQYTQTKTELNCKDTDKIVHVQVSRYPPALAKYGRHKKMKNNWIFFFLLMVTRISSFWEPDIVNRGGRGKERGAIALEAHTLLVQKNGKYHRSIGSTRISAQGTNCVRSSLVLVVELVFPTACSDHGTPRLCLDPLLCRLVTLSPTLRPLDRKTKKPS